jgi:hypothetical protein
MACQQCDSFVCGVQVSTYENWIVNMTRTQLKDFNKTLQTVPRSANFASLNNSLSLMDRTTKSYLKYSKIGTLHPKAVLGPAENLLSIMHNYTVYTVAIGAAQLDALCKAQTNATCVHPTLLDGVHSVQQPIEVPIPGTEAALKIK